MQNPPNSEVPQTDPSLPQALPQAMTLFGRPAQDPGSTHKRAAVHAVARAAYTYETGAKGASEVSVFRSQGVLDRGGMVLTLEVHDREGSFLPVARTTERGVELHVAGEAEAEAMILALQRALLHTNADRARRVGVTWGV